MTRSCQLLVNRTIIMTIFIYVNTTRVHMCFDCTSSETVSEHCLRLVGSGLISVQGSEDVNLRSRRKVNVYLRSASLFRLPIWLSYTRPLPNPSGGSVDKREQIGRKSIKNGVLEQREPGREEGKGVHFGRIGWDVGG